MTRLLSIGAWTMALVLIGEISARAVEVLRPSAEDVTFDYAPYRMLRMVDAPFRLNQDGFRAADLDSYKDSFLVEFIGGSVCLGIGTSPGKPVPERLEEALHRAGMPEAKVLNLCQGGTASAQELAILLEYGLPLEPRVVVSFNGANDLLHPSPMGFDRAPNLPYQSQRMQALFQGHHSWTEHLASSRFMDRFARRFQIYPPSVPPPVAAEEIIGSLLYVTDAERILAESRGATFAWILQPTLHYEKPFSADELQSWHRLRPRDPRISTEYAHRLFSFLRIKASAWSRRNETPLFDLTDVFRETRGTVYTDSVHFQGSAGFERLEQQLEARGFVEMIAKQYGAWKDEQPVRGKESTISWRQ